MVQITLPNNNFMDDMDDMDDYVKVAEQVARKAGKILLASFRQRHKVTYKDNLIGSIVTKNDREAEAIILDLIEEQYPHYNLLSEERGFVNKNSDYCWEIDPLDGTINYVAGLPIWGVTVALLERKVPLLGVIFLPFLKEMFVGIKNKGAFLNGKRIEVGKVAVLKEAVIGGDVGYGNRTRELESTGLKLIDECRYLLYLGCCAAGLAFVASGRLSAYVHPYATFWEPAAAYPIIKEAGGEMTDFFGKPINWRKDRLPVLASNGKIHQAIIQRLK